MNKPMSTNGKRVLIIEDSPSLARTYGSQLQSAGCQTTIVESGEAAKEAVRKGVFDCLLLDLRLPDADGMELMETWISDGLACPVVVITAHASINIAIDAIRRGAFDFLTKPFDGQRLTTTVNNALAHSRLETVVRTYREKIDRASFCDFVGSSLEMQAIYRMLEGSAPSKATVFLTGESGTGKELAARAIHNLSPRSSGPFVAINCGAIPKELMESELFGHVKGAFTGATGDRLGSATQADGGTFFLDEITEMDSSLQTKLLRFIQMGTYQPVGSHQARNSDIRFIAATNREPLEAVNEGKLREDLYYRLHVIPIRIPPLRERGEDMLELARHFLEKYALEEGKVFTGIDTDAEHLILSHSWPGNVRQLENVVRNIVVLNDEDCLTVSMIRPLLQYPQSNGRNEFSHNDAPLDKAATEDSQATTDSPNLPPDTITALWKVEKRAIEHAIRATGGNVQKAARLLEISPSTIYRKKEDWQQRS